MKTTLKVILVFILILALSVNAFASTIGLQWTYLSRITSLLSINAYGKATATGSVTLKDNDKVSVEVNLQQLKSDGWTTIKTWTGSDIQSCVVSGKYYVMSDNSYRTETIARVYNANGDKLEEDKIYSDVRKY